MCFSTLPFLFFFACLSLTTALYYKDVTSKDFDTLIDSSKASILLEFYAPWCGHCKTLAPEYEQLGQTLERQPDVIIAQVDADKYSDLAKRFNVKGFPTLKWVQKGSPVDKAVDVDAGRTAVDLLNYVNSKTGLSKKLKADAHSSVVELTADNFDTIVLDGDTYAFVGFFAPWCGHCKAMKPIWEKFAALYADEPSVVVGAVDCDAHPSLAEKYGVGGFPSLKVFGKGDVDVEDYNGGRQLDDFVKFINEKSGLDISSDGGVLPTGGIVHEISDYVKSFVSAPNEEERQKAMDFCKDQVDKLDEKARDNYKYYSKVFANIAEKGMDYVNREKQRLSKVLESKGLKASQKRSFLRRMNVLNIFDDL